ncbi:MAG: tetratricopeptide repeat protein [Chloroflexi bacterium]|nr:tetratricopeptide repeat protein [Chloroflexota bacterium]
MNETLRLSLLGSPLIQLENEPVTGLSPQKVKALLLYLAYTAQPQPRELLAELFFDDRPPKQAAANLRAMVSRLRKKLKPFVAANQETIGFDTSASFWLDTAVLAPILQTTQQQIAHDGSLTPETAVQLTNALTLYRGEFLAGFHVREARNFGEWALLERERWHHQIADALQALIAHHLHRREYVAGIAQARRLIRLDNLQENAHRQLMMLLARSGDRSAALTQYESCRQILAQELGVEPMAETTALYERIRTAQTAVPHNLPPQFTPFVGRADELDQISRRLDDPNCRLLTLVGSGGVGKTRLALEAAGERIGDYLNGVFFVPLAPLDDPSSLVTVVANAVQFHFSGREPIKSQLLNHLRSQEALLVLDNFEHLLAGSELALDILKAAPHVKILATSRERLNFSMEWTLNIRGLVYPENETTITPLVEYEAAQLFLDSARRANADFVLDDRTAPHVQRICQLIEGLPLGLELAAAATRERPLAEVAASIEKNAAALATTMRDLSPRHRSVQALFDHSWAMLTERERQIFKRLTVFRGSFDKAAAEAVADAMPFLLARLAAKSLLRQRENGRYNLHELWRQLGAEKLSSAEYEDARERRGRYYAAWVEQKSPDLTNEKQAATVARINADSENIRASWNWAVRQQQWPLIQQYLAGFNDWHNIRAMFQKGTDAYGQTIAALKRSGATDEESSRLLGQLLAYQGFFLFRLARFEQAKEKLGESLTILRPLDALQMMLKPLGGLANIAIQQGDYGAAKQRYQENLEIALRLEFPHAIASSLEGIAMLTNHEGAYEKASELFQQCLEMRREIGDPHQTANTLGNLGTAYFFLNQHAAAEKVFLESLELRRSVNDRHGIILMLSNLGELALRAKAYAKAKNLYQECGEVSAAANHRLGQSDSQLGLGEVYFALGDYETAAENYLDALKEAMAAQLMLNVLLALVGLAGIAFERQQIEKSAELLFFVFQHPALNQEIKNRGAWLDAALAAKLSPAERKAVERRAGRLSLDDVATAVSGR